MKVKVKVFKSKVDVQVGFWLSLVEFGWAWLGLVGFGWVWSGLVGFGWVWWGLVRFG